MESIPQIVDMPLSTLLVVAAGGAVGAFVKDIFEDGAIVMPYCSGGKVYLGFIGGFIIGAFAGIVVDHSFMTAALGGFVGSSILKSLVNSSSPKRTVLEIKSGLSNDQSININASAVNLTEQK